MWLLRAATFAGNFGFISLPALAIVDCSQKNIICGIANCGKYLRTAEIQSHLSCVLEYMFDEVGGTFLDICAFLVRSGSVLVVVDLVKYVGIALGFVVIDQTLRFFRIIGDDEYRTDTHCRRHGEMWMQDERKEVAAAECEPKEEVPSRPSTSWAYVTTWDDLMRKRLEKEKRRHDPEPSIDERCLSYENSSKQHSAHDEVEKDGSKISREEGNLKQVLLVVDALHVESSKDTDNGSDITLSPLTDVFLSRLKDAQLHKEQHLQRTSSEDLTLSQPSAQPHNAGQNTRINPYDADISDQENTIDSTVAGRSCISGSAISYQAIQRESDPVPVPRCSTSASPYEMNNRTAKTYRQRWNKSEGQRKGTYTSLRRLHCFRGFGNTQRYADSSSAEVNPDDSETSSEEFVGHASAISIKSNSIQNPNLTTSREGFVSKTHISRQVLCESSDEVFDASSYILSSRSLSSVGIPKRGSSQDSSKIPASDVERSQNRMVSDTQYYVNTPRQEGIQEITFWQFPVFNTNILPGQNTPLPSMSRIGNSLQSQVATCSSLQQDGRHSEMVVQRSSQPLSPNQEILQSLEMTYLEEDIRHFRGRSQSQRSRNSSPFDYEEMLSFARRGPSQARASFFQNIGWRVFFLHVVCWILFGRHWRKLF